MILRNYSKLMHVNSHADLKLSVLHAGFVMQDLRSMVAYLSGTDLAVAGHAVALAGWHQVCLQALIT